MKIAEYLKLNFQTKIKLASNIHWKSKSIIKLIKRSKHIYLSMFHVGHDTQMKWSKTLPIKILQRSMRVLQEHLSKGTYYKTREACVRLWALSVILSNQKRREWAFFLLYVQECNHNRKENQKIPKIFLFKDVWNRKSLLWFLYVMFVCQLILPMVCSDDSN